MNEILPMPIGPGGSGFDPARAIPEPAASVLLVVCLGCVLWVARSNRAVSRKFKRRELTPMPTALRYGGGK